MAQMNSDHPSKKSLEELAAEDRRLEELAAEAHVKPDRDGWYPVVVDGKGRICSKCGSDRIVSREVGPLWHVRCNSCLFMTEVYDLGRGPYVPPAEAPCFPVELPDLRAELIADWASGAYDKVMSTDPSRLESISGKAARILSEADLYWVGPDMCELLYGSAPNVPGNVKSGELLFPSRAGFILFSRTWVTNQLVDALVWYNAHGPEDPGQTLVLWPYRKFLGSRYWKPGEPIIWSYGHRLDEVNTSDPDDYRFSPIEIEARQLISAFVTLLQAPTMTTETEEPMPRHVVRRAEREGRALSKVRLIYLRKPEGRSSDEPIEPGTVTWSHRWVSSAHYRRQPYGPRGAPTHYKLISIPASVKGPAHLPVVVRPTVRAWVR